MMMRRDFHDPRDQRVITGMNMFSFVGQKDILSYKIGRGKNEFFVDLEQVNLIFESD